MIDVSYLLDKLQKERIDKHIEPHGVMYACLCNEVFHQMNIELNQLFEDGRIMVEPTLNSKIITVL